jgi:hypothetical protein
MRPDTTFHLILKDDTNGTHPVPLELRMRKMLKNILRQAGLRNCGLWEGPPDDPRPEQITDQSAIEST